MANLRLGRADACDAAEQAVPAHGDVNGECQLFSCQLTSIFVDDQAKALDFQTRVLGFAVKNDEPLGDHRWLAVIASEDPDGSELLLEPNALSAVTPFQSALFSDGIPAASFAVDDLDAGFERRTCLGVRFAQHPIVQARFEWWCSTTPAATSFNSCNQWKGDAFAGRRGGVPLRMPCKTLRAHTRLYPSEGASMVGVPQAMQRL